MTAWLYEMAAQAEAAIAQAKVAIEAERIAKRPTLHLRGDWMRADGFVEFTGMTPMQATHLVRVLIRAVPPTLSGYAP